MTSTVTTSAQTLLILLAVASSLLKPCAWCFSPALKLERRPAVSSWRGNHLSSQSKNTRHSYLTGAALITRTSPLRSTEEIDNQAQIAELEERLRQLKNRERGSATENDNIETIPPESPPTVVVNRDDELPDDTRGELEGESEDSVMFSERWKEAKKGYTEKNSTENINFDLGGIGKIGLGISFVLFLGWFSQLSVGEESLQRYQDVKGSSSRIDLGDLNPISGDL